MLSSPSLRWLPAVLLVLAFTAGCAARSAEESAPAPSAVAVETPTADPDEPLELTMALAPPEPLSFSDEMIAEMVDSFAASENGPSGQSSATSGPADEADAVAVRSGVRVVGAPVGVNVRQRPSIEATVVAQVETGRVVVATGVVSGSWVEVEADGAIGWAHSSYLEPAALPDPTTESAPIRRAPEAPVPSAGTAVIDLAPGPATVDAPLGVNLRSIPSTDGDVLALLADGTAVTRTGRFEAAPNRLWAEVVVDDTTAWVIAEVLVSAIS